MSNKITESRKTHWKDSDRLTLVRLSNGQHLVEANSRFYDADEINEALGSLSTSLAEAKAADILHLIDEDLVDTKGIIINEVRYDWSKIDPLTGMPKIKEQRPEDDIHLMSQMPARSCYIIMLQNRVNLNSVGNIRYKKRLWYDRPTQTVSTDKTMEDAVHFRRYVLPGAGRPQGWLIDKDQRDKQ